MEDSSVCLRAGGCVQESEVDRIGPDRSVVIWNRSRATPLDWVRYERQAMVWPTAQASSPVSGQRMARRGWGGECG